MRDLSPPSRQPPQSPLTASTPVSPAVSLFSAKGHTRFSSSASSLVSSPGHGNSMDIATRNPLTGVKEEEPCGSQARDLEEEYFRMLPLLPASFFLLCPFTVAVLLLVKKKNSRLMIDMQNTSIKGYPSLKTHTYPQSVLATAAISLMLAWIRFTPQKRGAPTMPQQMAFPGLAREYPPSQIVGSPNEHPTAQTGNRSLRKSGPGPTHQHLYLLLAQLRHARRAGLIPLRFPHRPRGRSLKTVSANQMHAPSTSLKRTNYHWMSPVRKLRHLYSRRLWVMSRKTPYPKSTPRCSRRLLPTFQTPAQMQTHFETD